MSSNKRPPPSFNHGQCSRNHSMDNLKEKQELEQNSDMENSIDKNDMAKSHNTVHYAEDDSTPDNEPTQDHPHYNDEQHMENESNVDIDDGNDNPDDVDHAAEDQGVECTLQNKDVAEELAKLTCEDIPLNEKIDTLADLLTKEKQYLSDTSLKDYERMDNLKLVLKSTEPVYRYVEDQMSELAARMNTITYALNAMKQAVDHKINNEGLMAWADQQTNYKDPDSVAREKSILAQVAEAKSVLARATRDIPKFEEKAAILEVQAVEAAAEANKAQQLAEEARLAAEAAKRAEKIKRQKEEEKRRQEEEETRKKEKEERKRQQEEERKRQEAFALLNDPEEQERRNPRNWPQWVYSIEPGETGFPIGCVIRAFPNTIQRDDINIDRIEQLSNVFHLGENEELVSNIVQISHSDIEFKVAEAMSIAIPHCAPRNASRECVIKSLMPNSTWVEVPTSEVTFEDMKEYKFVECRINKPTTLVVVTRYKKEHHIVHKRGGKVVSSVDGRVCFTVRQTMFKVSTNVTVEVIPVESSAVSEARCHKPNSDGLLASSPIIKFQTPLRKFTKPVMVNVPLPPDPNKIKQRPNTAVTGNKNLSSSGGGMTNRPKSATPHAEDGEEDDCVHLLTPDEDGLWVIDENITLVQPKNKDIVTFEMEKPMGRFIILRTKRGVTFNSIEKIPSDIEQVLKEKYVQIILRQKSDDANDVLIQCCPINKIESTLKKLADNGYDYGPMPSPGIIMSEGQHLQVTFRGNITSEENDTLDMVFNSHIKTKVYFQVKVKDKFAQKSIDVYRGFAQIFMLKQNKDENSETKQRKPVLINEQLINLPKPDQEAPKPIVERAPVCFKSDGLVDKDMLQQLASELGDEWKRLAQFLNVKKVRIQAIQRNNINRDMEHAIYDMLVTWIKRVPKSANKVEILCQALVRCGRVDLAEVMKDKELDFKREKSRSARDSYLRKAFVRIAQSPHVVSDWKFLARQLELRELEIGEVDNACTGMREKCFHALVKWQEVYRDEATPENLQKALRKCRYYNVADQIQEILKEAI